MSRWRLLLVAACLGLLAAVEPIAGPPVIGAPAPDFTLKSQEGKTVTLRDFRGKWVVLYFYPKDFTSGCTLQAHNFQRDLPKYEAINATIVGVSIDSVDSHKSFCAKEGLSFKLLSDPDAKISAEYESVMEYQSKTLSARNTFLIDPEGRLMRKFADVRVSGHSEEVLHALSQLQTR